MSRGHPIEMNSREGYRVMPAMYLLSVALPSVPERYKSAQQAVRDLLHMYGWVVELSKEQEAYVFERREMVADLLSNGKSIDAITRALFENIPRELRRLVRRERFSDKYQPRQGSLASADDTQVILERVQERREKKEISRSLRESCKDIEQIWMRKE